IQSLWQFQLHSKFVPYLGFLEKFMNTHKQHQVHHSSNIDYLDKNHGGYLNIFDRIFGTHKVLDDSQEIKFGVLHPPQSYNPLVIVSHEYRDIWQDVKSTKNWKEKFMYVFGPPGWSPDGSRKTVKEMQEEKEKVEIKKPVSNSSREMAAA
ncbi:MAG: sterol desaturase family protein, partial [Cytophagales bacterium]